MSPTASAPSTSAGMLSPTYAMSPGGEAERIDDGRERARVRLAHERIGDDHAIEHIGMKSVPVQHFRAERIVGEQRERQPGAQRLERGHDVVEQRRVERGEERLDQLGRP